MRLPSWGDKRVLRKLSDRSACFKSSLLIRSKSGACIYALGCCMQVVFILVVSASNQGCSRAATTETFVGNWETPFPSGSSSPVWNKVNLTLLSNEEGYLTWEVQGTGTFGGGSNMRTQGPGKSTPIKWNSLNDNSISIRALDNSEIFPRMSTLTASVDGNQLTLEMSGGRRQVLIKR